jgi:hypothetical protein
MSDRAPKSNAGRRPVRAWRCVPLPGLHWFVSNRSRFAASGRKSLLRKLLLLLLPLLQPGFSAPAAASMMCMRIDQLGAIDTETKGRIVRHALTNLGTEPSNIQRLLTSRFYILRSSEDKCRGSLCHYHLVQVNPESVKE